MNRVTKIQELQRELDALARPTKLLVVFHFSSNPPQLSVCLEEDCLEIEASDLITFEYDDNRLSILTKGTKYDSTERASILEATKLWLEEDLE